MWTVIMQAERRNLKCQNSYVSNGDLAAYRRDGGVGGWGERLTSQRVCCERTITQSGLRHDYKNQVVLHIKHSFTASSTLHSWLDFPVVVLLIHKQCHNCY